MSQPPIPPNTHANIVGAIGDVMRAGVVYGQATAGGEPSDVLFRALMQYAAQAFAIIFQRDPSAEDIDLMFKLDGE